MAGPAEGGGGRGSQRAVAAIRVQRREGQSARAAALLLAAGHAASRSLCLRSLRGALAAQPLSLHRGLHPRPVSHQTAPARS